MATMNLDRFGRQKRLEKVAVATIRVVVEWDRFDQTDTDLSNLPEDDIPTRMLEQEEYQRLIDQQDVSKSDLYSVSQLVKRELSQHSFFPF